jgi:hypothetical protein
MHKYHITILLLVHDMSGLVCHSCHRNAPEFICGKCACASTSTTLSDFHEKSIELKTIRATIHDWLRPRRYTQIQSVRILEEAVCVSKTRVQLLRRDLDIRRRSLHEAKCALNAMTEVADIRKKRYTPKKEFQVAFEDYIKNPAQYEKILSTLHPFHKLRGLGNSLAEERRLACMSVLSMYRFRFINIQKPASSPGGSGITTELVGDFDALDSSADQLHIVLLFLVPTLIILTRILDIPIPFPVVYGTLVSSPNLHSPISALETGCPSYPRILHAYKRVLSPLCTTQGVPTEGLPGQSSSTFSPVVFRNSCDLIVQDLQYISWLCGSTTQLTDPVAILSAIITSPNLGRVFSSTTPAGGSPRTSPVSPSSPVISGPGSPAAGRKNFEQSLAEGGEWTLLDQL